MWLQDAPDRFPAPARQRTRAPREPSRGAPASGGRGGPRRGRAGPKALAAQGPAGQTLLQIHRGGKVVVEGALRLFCRSLYNQQSSPPSSLASPRTIDLPLRRRESLTDDVLERAWLWTSVNQASPSSQPQQLPTSFPGNSWVRMHWVKYNHGLMDLTMWQSNPFPLIESTVATGKRDSWQNCLSTPV